MKRRDFEETPEREQCHGTKCGWRSGNRGDPHTAGKFYSPCWRCSGSLGCSNCAGAPTEVLCKRCAAWGTPEAFAQHGPILNTPVMIAKRRGIHAPEVRDYPLDFQAAYRTARSRDEDPVPVSSSIKAIVERLADAKKLEGTR